MFEAIIAKYCLVPVSVVLSVIHVESSGRPQAFLEDKRGLTFSSYGLMQVTFATAKEMKCGVNQPADLYKPEINIKCGCRYLDQQMKRYKNRKASLVGYNQGSVLLDKKIILNYKTLSEEAMKGVDRNIYANKVLTHRSKICKIYSDCGLN